MSQQETKTASPYFKGMRLYFNFFFFPYSFCYLWCFSLFIASPITPMLLICTRFRFDRTGECLSYTGVCINLPFFRRVSFFILCVSMFIFVISILFSLPPPLFFLHKDIRGEDPLAKTRKLPADTNTMVPQ